MKLAFIGTLLVLAAAPLIGAPAEQAPLGIVSDWTHHHVLYPDSKNDSATARIQKDPRRLQSWYLRHPEAWWPEYDHIHRKPTRGIPRDWSLSLSASPLTSGFEPLFDFSFSILPETGYGSLNTTDEGYGEYMATAGNLTVTGGDDIGTYPLYPGDMGMYPSGPGSGNSFYLTSPMGAFYYNNLFYTPSTNPQIDLDGLLFTTPGLEINIWGNSPGNYSYYDYTSGGFGTQLTEDGTFLLNPAPGGGQTYPAKFSFDVNAAPSCANDFVVIGIPANAALGGQANIVGVNNLYSSPDSTGFCPTSGPTVKFAYASGAGQVPASVSISLSGTQIAYVENLLTGSSYFHVLTIGTTTNEGTSATAAVTPGAGASNAADQRVLLSPDGGTTNQSSTNSVFVNYANATAYATTYSRTGNGSGYLYKIGNVFSGSAAPVIVWSVPINAVPSTPVYDSVSNRVFVTDSNGRIDYVTDTGASPSVVYSAVLAACSTSENPVTVDSTNQMVYASFNSNGTNAIVAQGSTSLASSVAVAVGTASTTYTGPYGPDFNNAWYTGSGTPLMYVAGTGTGMLPTLYSIGFNGSGVMNSSVSAETALATGIADSSPVAEFYNTSLGKDYLFVGVTNLCIATSSGGSTGCVMSLDITNGFPAVGTGSTALAASGGTTGIVIDGDSTVSEGSSIYYATKTGVALVKATQSGLN
jgi:hypothetical protein